MATTPHTRTITAPQLRIVLLVSMALVLAITIAAFWYFRSELVNYAKQVQDDNAKAIASSSDINKLKTLKQQLADDQGAVARTKSIVADSQYYQYQNQIIEDINAYAKKAGVTLSGFTFNEAAGAATSAPTAGSPAAVSLGGLKSVSVSIGIKSPLDYNSLMQFIHYIEVNLTKMQISGIALKKSTGGSQVDADQITLEVYTR